MNLNEEFIPVSTQSVNPLHSVSLRSVISSAICGNAAGKTGHLGNLVLEAKKHKNICECAPGCLTEVFFCLKLECSALCYLSARFYRSLIINECPVPSQSHDRI